VTPLHANPSDGYSDEIFGGRSMQKERRVYSENPMTQGLLWSSLCIIDSVRRVAAESPSLINGVVQLVVVIAHIIMIDTLG